MNICKEYHQFRFTNFSTFCVKMFSIISHHEIILWQFYVFFHETCYLYIFSPWHKINAICLLGHACITNFHIMNVRFYVLFTAIHQITINFIKSFYTHKLTQGSFSMFGQHVMKSRMICYRIKVKTLISTPSFHIGRREKQF